MLFIVAAIVPVIVRLAEVTIAPELMAFTQTHVFGDLFSYHKSWILMACTGIIVLSSISEHLTKSTGLDALKQKTVPLLKDPVIILVAIYLFFVILSNIFSLYTHTSLWGTYDRREGIFVQFAYMVVFLATLFYVNVKDEGHARARFLLTGLLISSLIMGSIGFSQFINRDFFSTAFAYRLIIPSRIVLEDFIIGFDIAYGTNFNPNTFGLVTAMLFPVLLGAALAFGGRLWKGLFLFASLLMAIGVIGSRSVGGFIGASAAIGVVIATLMVRWFFTREKKTSAEKSDKGKLAIAMLLGLVVIAGAGTALRQPIYENLTFTMGRIAAIFEPPAVQLPAFVFEENRLTMTDRGITYHISFPVPSGVPEVTDAHGIQIMHRAEQEEGSPLIRYIYEIPGFGNITILRQDIIYNYRGILMTVIDGNLHMMMQDGQLVNPHDPIPSWGFEGWETWGSNRGFIFARTIPLLPQFWLLGSGSDTFVLQFPQHDIISKARYFNNPYILIDKAHNLYLQTAVTTGWISAFALIGLFGHFILTTFWSLVKHSREKAIENNSISSIFWLRLGILASVSAFAISSLSTDSTVSSTPIFWLIIGIGYALNQLQKKGGKGTNPLAGSGAGSQGLKKQNA